MKKYFCLFLFFLLAAGSLAAQISRGGTAWIAVRSVNLKSSTWFFASDRGLVNYADQVSVLQVSGNWAEVRSVGNPSLTGWITLANLSARRLIAGQRTGATASEVAMAGKGFNQDVENAYRADGNLNYNDVDRTEAIFISMEELLRFITEGRLASGENR